MPHNSRQNILNKRSFRGENLSDRDFSYSDIRGIDFTKAILRGANFSHARAGQRGGWLALIVILGTIVAAIAGLISGYAGGLIGLLLFGNSQLGALLSKIAGVFFCVTFSAFIFLVVRQGFGKILGFFTIGIVTIAAVVVAKGVTGVAVAAIIPTFALAAAITATIVWSLSLATIWIAGGRIIVTIVACITLLCSIPGAIEGTAPEDTNLQILFGLSRMLALCFASIIIIITFLASTYLSKQAIARNAKFHALYSIINFLSSIGGTSFRSANLTDADFTQANLKGADFRGANLTRTCWFQVKKLDLARIGGIYLENLKLRRLLVLKDAQGEDLSDYDLRRMNLKGANLQKINFSGSDLSEATLENANLSGAKLVKAQLYQTNLSGACLTGTVIQDWAISTDTKFEGVQCEHIYMRFPTEDDPDPWRKPDNRKEIFKEGDFADFIAPIIKTLDLYSQQNIDPRQVANTFKTLDFYHYGGIDPTASAIALKQLTDENPEANIEIVALEGRGDEKIRLQAIVSSEANQSELSEKYFEKYGEILSLPYSDLQALLTGILEKDERIRSLEKMVMTAIESNKFYVETYYNLGDTVSEKSSINIQSGGGDISGIFTGDVSGVVNLGQISGDVTNAINQLPDSSEPNKPSIKDLLTQLQIAVEAESELASEDKAEALEQVKVLAEAGQKPEDNAFQKTAKTAIKILKGTIAGLPDAAKLAEAGAKLLPTIATLLGLV